MKNLDVRKQTYNGLLNINTNKRCEKMQTTKNLEFGKNITDY